MLRKTLPLLMITLLHASSSNAQWTTVNTGITSTILDMVFVDDNVGYACGVNGVMIKTTNGGDNWTEVENPATGYLWAVQFLDATNGYAVGDYGEVIRTTDGGDTWTLSVTSILTTNRDLHFVDATTGYICGEGDLLYKTTDGGSSFTSTVTTGNVESFFVHFFDTENGIVSGQSGHFMLTDDGGISFTDVLNGGVDLAWKDIEFPNNGTVGYALNLGNVYKTTNSGASWTEIDINGSPQWDAHYLSADVGIAVADDGMVNTTLDGGTFTYEWAPVTPDLRTCYVKPDGTAFIAGVQGLMMKKALSIGIAEGNAARSLDIVYDATGLPQLNASTSMIGAPFVMHDAAGRNVGQGRITSSLTPLGVNLSRGTYSVQLLLKSDRPVGRFLVR